MSDRPILFSAPMVRALLDGRKTQTRRVLKPQPRTAPIRQMDGLWTDGAQIGDVQPLRIPYAPGGRLWVKETFCAHWGAPAPNATEIVTGTVKQQGGAEIVLPHPHGRLWAYYRADNDQRPFEHLRWTPSIHMSRWASRLTLTVTDVRVQRVQEISEADAEAEGVEQRPSPAIRLPGFAFDTPTTTIWSPGPRPIFRELWDSLNAKRPGCSWADNPFVVAVTFTVHRSNIDQQEA